MTHEQREEYIRQAKKSFQNHPHNRERKENFSYKPNSFDEKDFENQKSFGFWKVRLLIAVVLFGGIFSLHQTKHEDAVISFDKITAMVEKNFDTQAVAAWFEQ